jgi:hypothetical protein
MLLGGTLHTLKKNTEAFLVGSKEIGLEVNADKTKYMVMSRVQNAERSHNIKSDNSFFEMVEEFKLFENNFNKSQFYSGRNSEQSEFRRCLLSFGAEDFVFEFAIQNVKN